MTPTRIFHSDDRQEAMRFLKTHPFAMLAVNGQQGPVSAMVPLVADKNGQVLLGHVARNNPFWKSAKEAQHAIAIFKGVDAYVSPSLYASKKEHGKVVPTWNYMALEVRGAIRIETDPSAMMPYITALTDTMESHRDMPWKVSDAPDDYIERLSHGIVGFQLKIDDMSYVRKLSQNKSSQDLAGVIAEFETSDSHEQVKLAKEMKET